MSITARCLIESKFAADSDTIEYTSTVHTIIDKFTVTNTDGSTQTVSINLIPSVASGVAADSNLIIKALSLTTGQTVDVDELKNQILNAGDVISVIASVASKVVIRASGRETP